LFQKCNKESRLTLFGNIENVSSEDFQREVCLGQKERAEIAGNIHSSFAVKNFLSKRDIKIDIGRLLRRVAPEQSDNWPDQNSI
jgi:hypothetical protein